MIVVDTHAFIWDALDSSRLSVKAKAAIHEAEQLQELWLSDFSVWEVFMLAKRGRLELPVPAARFVELAFQARHYQLQRLTPAISEAAVNFGPEINNDPADRIIVATARHLHASLVTADLNLQTSGLVKTLW
jgi:PIN domain nuclease of toxin-antitoxin system